MLTSSSTRPLGEQYTIQFFETITHFYQRNCPKYINHRDLEPHPNTLPSVAYKQLQLGPEDRLPDELIALIHESDTTFLGTSYEAPEDEANFYPSHVGQNHRGGRQGFIRVRPCDGRTVVLPDYSGSSTFGTLQV